MSRLSRDYVAGVNFLLSNQQDKAVDLFLDMLKEDTGTVEAHLTLGNLFRSRGEVDRAIRIHQSLMESASLTYDQRLLAVQQLGRDIWPPDCMTARKTCSNSWWMRPISASARCSNCCRFTERPATGGRLLKWLNGW